MLTHLALHHPADAVEAAVPDADAGAALLLSRRPELLAWLAQWKHGLVARFGDSIRADASRTQAALRVALARVGLRHGSWGQDFHAYHNENHALELMDGRLSRLVRHADTLLDGRDRMALALFCACHDLRQRENGDADLPVGANEAASVAESARILASAGFDPRHDAWLYRTLELAIAGSTFDALPLPEHSRSNTAELAARGGPLAPRLSDWLDARQPDWCNDPVTVHALRLAQIASDLDTANVAEPLLELAASSIRLCEEREMRAGRSLTSPESAEPCFSFLTDGQERYFFELHRFCSDVGRLAFADGKRDNEGPLRALVDTMRRDLPHGPAPEQTGLDIVRHFARRALHHSD
ncbi:hypothetical protein OS187_05465 [Xanthomonadaceae bacterium JHOS43]|nr:hypothetical protein [Xanthomonadaceae bacterium JHOS43]